MEQLSFKNVPEQTHGSSSFARESVWFDSVALAKEFFDIAQTRLRNVNQWGEISKIKISTFRLFDSLGYPANRLVIEGDYIRIKIPGPGLKIGMGYDWVRVEELIHENTDVNDQLIIRVRPSSCPWTQCDKIAHFLNPMATSTFKVVRNHSSVKAMEYARNEKANLKTGRILDNLRNAIVGTAARLGLSYPQWKSLMAGIVS